MKTPCFRIKFFIPGPNLFYLMSTALVMGAAMATLQPCRAGDFGDRSIAPARAASRNAINAQWVPTGELNGGRYLHTATLLRDGRMLVAGGINRSFAITASAELYDPATGASTAIGSMLVAGGSTDKRGPRNGITVAELYDPASQTWSATGSLSTGRYSHTATLLHNGGVLIAGGGISIHAETATAELFDPTSGAWRQGASLSTARQSHTATRLRDGSVLVAGGVKDIIDVLASAELFLP